MLRLGQSLFKIHSKVSQRGDKKKKRKKWRHHLKNQSYVVAPSQVFYTNGPGFEPRLC